MAQFDITFKTKQLKSGNYKVPTITGNHINLIGNEDLSTTLFISALNNEDLTRARLANMRYALTGDHYWPSRIDDTTPGFTITPIGNGYFSNITITLDTNNIRKKPNA